MLQEKKTPGASIIASGAEEVTLSSEKPYIWGDAIARLGLEKTLLLKPKGYYRIDTEDGQTTITVCRPGEPEEYLLCASLGHANRVRQHLSDQGMAGFIEGAL